MENVFWLIFVVSVSALLVLVILKAPKRLHVEVQESKKSKGLDWPIADRATGVPIIFDED